MTAQTNDFAGLKEARAVWDFSTGDEKIFLERLGLVKNSIEILRRNGVTPRYVMLLRGAVLKFVAKSVDRTSFAGERFEKLDRIHAELEELARLGVKIEACLYAMNKRGVAADNVLALVVLEENVFANAIALQNSGYAFMQVD
ncbi:MAG TPA: hypothetical protein VFB20_15110 [Burkholderiales bacterium]|nr:hypothetical protein [Burkholderiales bacterium]